MYSFFKNVYTEKFKKKLTAQVSYDFKDSL